MASSVRPAARYASARDFMVASVRRLSGPSFFSTDPGMDPVAMIAASTGRWDLETTFQELRCHLGLETTRGRCRRAVLRAAPFLFGLYTVVALLDRALPEAKRSGRVAWPGKEGVTFSDALTSVRR